MRVNGEETKWTETVTLLRFLHMNGFEPKSVAVERNGVIVPQRDFAEISLKQDDVLEILRFVGGG